MTINLTSGILKKPLFWVALISILVAGISGGYLAFQYRSKILGWVSPVKSSVLPTSDSLTPDQTQKVIAEVGKIIQLPTGETPTIATITDISKLAGQEFFLHAQNGDQVLIYTVSKKAFLYNPTLKKIIDVQPINFASASATPETQVPTVLPTPITVSTPIPSPFVVPTATPTL